jgi:DNA polymerase-3 subunit delta'
VTTETPSLLPWLDAALRQAVDTMRGHALLIHGAAGVGQFDLGVALAQAWLCEAGPGDGARPCGRCASCRLVQARSHPDLLVLVPEALQEELGWGAGPDDAERATKAKPSKDIRVDAVRAAIAFAQTTSARGRCKVIVLHPAERMNGVAANSLLKTLEEPPGSARILLCTAAADALLPTVRSRCQALALGLPPNAMAVNWLASHGLEQPQVLLAATGGQPLLALEWSRQGIDAASWSRLPSRVRQGDATPLAGWPLPRVIDALQKLCHDAGALATGAQPRYFPSDSILPGATLRALADWMAALNRVSRHSEHPWNAGLMNDSLVQQGRRALSAGLQSSG